MSLAGEAGWGLGTVQEEEELHEEKMLTEFNVKRRTEAWVKAASCESGCAERTSTVSGSCAGNVEPKGTGEGWVPKGWSKPEVVKG